jgi:hypothetical protein
MITPRDPSIDAVTTAWRPRDPVGTVRAHPAWHDLDAEGREEAYEATRVLRAMEAALDQQGLSTTAKAVLRRIQSPWHSPPG